MTASNSKRKLIAGFMAVVAASTLGLGSPQLRNAFAHEADCPVCELPVVEKEEVHMKFGRKNISYRCVLCAIAEAKSEYSKSNVTITAPSEKSSKKITVKRIAGKWAAAPASTVFLKANVKHRQCHIGYRAFTSKAAAAAWAKKNGFENKPLSLSQMVAVSK